MTIPQKIEMESVKYYKYMILKNIKSCRNDSEERELKFKLQKINDAGDIWPDYADNIPYSGNNFLLERLGANRYYYNGNFVTELNGNSFVCPPLDGFFKKIFKTVGKQPKGLKEVNITSVKDFKHKIRKLKSNINESGEVLYRGQRDSYWGLQSGISRHEYAHLLSPSKRKLYEKKLFQQFKLKARPYIEGQIVPKTDWEWLILGQHYGLPTMLLDWTRNPLCALYFSVRGNHGDRDGIIYAYHHVSHPLNLDDYPDPMKLKRIELIEPTKVTPRVVAQDSVFTAEPSSNVYSEKLTKNGVVESWYIRANNIERIRNELGNLGINEDSIFPNLERVCTTLKGQIS